MPDLIAQLRQAKLEHERTVLSPEKLEKVDAFRAEFWSYIDDLKTTEAVSMIWKVLKSNIPGGDKYDLIIEFDEALGLGLAKSVADSLPTQAETISLPNLPEGIQELLTAREEARTAKNWQLADELRSKIGETGYDVTDDVRLGQVVTKKQ